MDPMTIMAFLNLGVSLADKGVDMIRTMREIERIRALPERDRQEQILALAKIESDVLDDKFAAARRA